MATDPEARQRDIDAFKEALTTFLESSGTTLGTVAAAVGVSESALRAYRTRSAYVPSPFLVHDGREGLSRRRLLDISIALLTLADVPRRPMRQDIDALLLKAGYAPLDHNRGQDAGVLQALRRMGERVSAARCEAFAGAPGAIAGEWLAEVAQQEEHLGPRLMFLDHLNTLALPPVANEQILVSLPVDQILRWKDAMQRRQRAFEQYVTRYPVRHLYRRPALERWVMWLTNKGAVPFYSTLIDRETASQHFVQMIELLERYKRRGTQTHGLEIGLSDEPGGFNFEILGEEGGHRVLLIDSESGRLPAPQPYPPDITPLEGLRIEGEQVIKLYERAWTDACGWATKGEAVEHELAQFAERLRTVRSKETAVRRV